MKVGRAVTAVAGLMLPLMPLPHRVLHVGAPQFGKDSVHWQPARVLILSDQARRFLQLQYRGFATEFMGCMIGEVRGQTIVVQRIAPADVDPLHSTATWVVPQQTCENAGWTGTIGMIHSHPSGERCWYFFPGTQVPSSDGHSFLASPYAVDAIMCGTRVVWISRDLTQQEVSLTTDGNAHLVSASAP